MFKTKNLTLVATFLIISLLLVSIVLASPLSTKKASQNQKYKGPIQAVKNPSIVDSIDSAKDKIPNPIKKKTVFNSRNKNSPLLNSAHTTQAVFDSLNQTNQTECKGDVNFDQKVDFDDIDYFNLVKDNPSYAQTNLPNMYWRADINNDQVVNQVDVDLFVALLGKPLTECRPYRELPPQPPENFTYCKGDLNHDSNIDFNDIDLMHLTLTYPSVVAQSTPWVFANADINNDTVVNQIDLNHFVSILGNSCIER